MRPAEAHILDQNHGITAHHECDLTHVLRQHHECDLTHVLHHRQPNPSSLSTRVLLSHHHLRLKSREKDLPQPSTGHLKGRSPYISAYGVQSQQSRQGTCILLPAHDARITRLVDDATCRCSNLAAAFLFHARGQQHMDRTKRARGKRSSTVCTSM